MSETDRGKATGDQVNAVWPPPPTGHIEGVISKVPIVARLYLTNRGWLDTIAGIGIGLMFQWLAFYGVMGCIQHLIPRRVDYFWNVVIGCGIALLVSLLIWHRLRLFYRRMANTALCAGFIESVAVMYFFY